MPSSCCSFVRARFFASREFRRSTNIETFNLGGGETTNDRRRRTSELWRLSNESFRDRAARIYGANRPRNFETSSSFSCDVRGRYLWAIMTPPSPPACIALHARHMRLDRRREEGRPMDRSAVVRLCVALFDRASTQLCIRTPFGFASLRLLPLRKTYCDAWRTDISSQQRGALSIFSCIECELEDILT